MPESSPRAAVGGSRVQGQIEPTGATLNKLPNSSDYKERLCLANLRNKIRAFPVWVKAAVPHASKGNSEHLKKNQPGDVQELSNLITSLLRACPRRVEGGEMHGRVNTGG